MYSVMEKILSVEKLHKTVIKKVFYHIIQPSFAYPSTFTNDLYSKHYNNNVISIPLFPTLYREKWCIQGYTLFFLFWQANLDLEVLSRTASTTLDDFFSETSQYFHSVV